MTLTATRKATKAEAGLLGARARWDGHVPRVVRLHELTMEQRRLVLALIDAAKSAQESAPTVGEMPAEASVEVSRASDIAS